MIFHQFFANGFMGLAAAEKDPIRHNAGAASPFLQHAKEESQEKKLRFLCIGDRLQIIVDAFRIDGPFKWRIEFYLESRL